MEAILSEVKYWYLRNHRLFRVLSNSQIQQLCITTRFREAKKGDVIYLPPHDEARVFLLKKGNIKISDLNDKGDEIIKDIIRQGDLFGELGLDTQHENNEQAIALTNDVVICSFLLKDFEKLMTEYPGLALSYTKLVGLKLRTVRNNYNNLISKDARARLKQFLYDWAVSEGRERNGELSIKNYLTQKDIAQIICTSRQTTTELLNEFESNGLLRYERKTIFIKDIRRLLI